MRRAFAAGFDSSWSKKPPTCRQLYNTLHTACANEAAPMRKKPLQLCGHGSGLNRSGSSLQPVNANSSWVIVDRGAPSTTTEVAFSQCYILSDGVGGLGIRPQSGELRPRAVSDFVCTYVLLFFKSCNLSVILHVIFPEPCLTPSAPSSPSSPTESRGDWSGISSRGLSRRASNWWRWRWQR